MNAARALLRRLLRPATAAWEPLNEELRAAAREEQLLGALADGSISAAAAELCPPQLSGPARGKRPPAAAAAIVRQRQAARALALPAQLAELDALLTAPAILLKGAAFACSPHVPDPGARAMSDIDLLLAPDAAARLRTGLLARGWAMIPGYDNYLYRPGSRFLPLDLHSEIICADRLTARAALNNAPGVAELLAQRIILPGYRYLAVLRPLPQGMTMLMHHLLHHGCRGVKWWLDFHNWWLAYPGERARLLTQAPPAWRAPLSFALWFYARLADADLPAAAQTIIRAEYRAGWPWYAERVLAGARAAPLRYLAVFAWLPPEQWPRYARELILPDGAALRAYYKAEGSAAALWLRHWRESWRLLVSDSGR